jgi:CCR4-NOT transcriptional complex subunit CAF120
MADEHPLHPEIRSIVSLFMAHTQKIYFSGPLIHKLESTPCGYKPQKDEGWRDIWAQLTGTTLSIWDMEEVKKAHQEGTEVPPSYVGITDAVRPPFIHTIHATQRIPSSQSVCVLGAVTQPAIPNSPRKYTNVITLNTAGMNLLLFSCPSTQDVISWVAAFRLSCWEKSRLEEIYTAHLIRITLNNSSNAPSTLTDGRLEGWVRVRIAGQTDWKRLWMCVSAGTISSATRSSTDVASISSKSPLIPGHNSYVRPKKRRISGLFLQKKSTGVPELPERARISLYVSPRRKDESPVLTVEAVTQAFAVYPERPELISSSTLFKLEGTYGDEEMCTNMKGREGCMLLMSDSAGVRGVSWEMQRWLIGDHASFSELL